MSLGLITKVSEAMIKVPLFSDMLAQGFREALTRVLTSIRRDPVSLSVAHRSGECTVHRALSRNRASRVPGGGGLCESFGRLHGDAFPRSGQSMQLHCQAPSSDGDDFLGNL